MEASHNVVVQILRFVDDAFPGWVECELTDVSGLQHVFRDKVPIFTTEVLDANSIYPRPGVHCPRDHRHTQSRLTGNRQSGRRLLHIDGAPTSRDLSEQTRDCH